MLTSRSTHGPVGLVVIFEMFPDFAQKSIFWWENFKPKIPFLRDKQDLEKVEEVYTPLLKFMVQCPGQDHGQCHNNGQSLNSVIISKVLIAPATSATQNLT